MLIRWIRVTAVAVLFLAAAGFPASADTCALGDGLCDPSPVVVYANPHWSIQLTSYGYSDFVIYRLPPFPRFDPRDPNGPEPLHEMFSGEWAFAIAYNGQVIWLEPCFVYPTWRSNSNFWVTTPLQFPGDSDNDGMLEGFSEITNGEISVRIEYDWEWAVDGNDRGTAMGRGSLATTGGLSYRLSDEFVLRQSFEITNDTAKPISDLRLVGMAAPHPSNTEWPGSSISLDWTAYDVGAFQDFSWDLTAEALNSGLTDGFETGTQFDAAVTYSLNLAADAWDIDVYQGHQFGDVGLPTDPVVANNNGLKPECGTHCNIENFAMNNAMFLEDAEVSAGFRLDLGDLGPGASASGDVLLAIATDASGVPATACAHIQDTGGDPGLLLSKGACKAAAPTAQPYDVVMGSLHELSRVPDCGTLGGDPIDCSALTNLVCKARQVAEDQVTLDDDAHETDALFYLVRRSAPFSSWGMGRNVATDLNDLFRLYFTAQTAAGIDVCSSPSTSRSAMDANLNPPAPGVGQLEAVGLGTPVPVRDNRLPLP